MVIAIVGATGVLGRNLIPLLCKEGMQVRALARSAAKINMLFGGSVDAVAMDLLQPCIEQAFGDILKGCDAVVHIATAIPADPKNQEGWTQMARLHTDMARAVYAALRQQPAGAILNINSEPVRRAEYLDRLAQLNGAAYPPRNPQIPCPPSIRSSSRAAQDILGWKPEMSIYPIR